MTLPGYFWDRWPYFAGKLSWDITTTQVNSALHPSGVTKSSTSFGWGKGGKVTSAGWQVTLCDLIWHVISRSGVVISMTVHFTFYFTDRQLQTVSKNKWTCEQTTATTIKMKKNIHCGHAQYHALSLWGLIHIPTCSVWCDNVWHFRMTCMGRALYMNRCALCSRLLAVERSCPATGVSVLNLNWLICVG